MEVVETDEIKFDKQANKILVQEVLQNRKAKKMAMACCKI